MYNTLGQDFNSLNEDDFKTGKEYRDSKTYLKAANYFFNTQKFSAALNYYKKVYKHLPTNALLNYRIGICYLNLYPKYKAFDYITFAFEKNNNISKDILYQLGHVYQLKYSFDTAKLYYNKYIESLPKNNSSLIAKTNKRIQECNNGIELINNPLNVEIINLNEQINSPYSDYRPFISENDSMIIFTSRRANTTGGEKSPEDMMYYEDIFISYKNNDGTWQEARKISSLNTMSHDAAVGMSIDGKTLVYYDGNKNGGDLYICNYNRNKWSQLEALPQSINSQYSESSATFSPSGDTIYYISDNPTNSLGKKDIFYSIKNKRGKWQQPKNAGAIINTPYNEEGASMHPNGKEIYFSSEGHKSMGGYDIYVCHKLEDGGWSEPQNIGHPINTPDDDVFFVISKSGKHAYYSSVKEEGIGKQDIYKIKFPVMEEILVEKALYLPYDETPLFYEIQLETKTDVSANNNTARLNTNASSSSKTLLSILDTSRYAFNLSADYKRRKIKKMPDIYPVWNVNLTITGNKNEQKNAARLIKAKKPVTIKLPPAKSFNTKVVVK
jgi:tetratricopeptide (TPR) repeat protein